MENNLSKQILKVLETSSRLTDREIAIMLGAYDFMAMVKGKTLREISLFVSGKLASIEEVQNTTTHFTLTKYKESGVSFAVDRPDERRVVTP